MCYGLTSGVLSAHALLLAKSAVELLVRTIVDHKNQFNRYQSWLLLLMFLFLALAQLYYLHMGLKLVTTSILYPFVFCIYNIIAILDGLIYFRQTDRLRPLHAGLIALGTVVLLTGVLALSWRLSEDDEDAAGKSHVYASEIPPSALTPGMGLVEDPAEPDATTDEDYDPDIEDGERAPLMQRRQRRHTLRDSALLVGRKRKQSNTFRERESIWDELNDDDDGAYYGSLAKARPGSRQSLPLNSHHRASTDENVNPLTGIKRSKTMSAADRALRPRSEELMGARRGRKQSIRARDSLSKNLMDWWRSRRKAGSEIVDDETRDG